MTYGCRPVDDAMISLVLQNVNWISEAAIETQQLFNSASRLIEFGRAGNYNISFLSSLPQYLDLNIDNCQEKENTTASTASMTTTIGN